MEEEFKLKKQSTEQASDVEVHDGVHEEVSKGEVVSRRDVLKKLVGAVVAASLGEAVSKNAEAAEKFNQKEFDKVVRAIVDEKRRLNILKHFKQDGIQYSSKLDLEEISDFLKHFPNSLPPADAIDAEIQRVSLDVKRLEAERDHMKFVRDGVRPTRPKN